MHPYSLSFPCSAFLFKRITNSPCFPQAVHLFHHPQDFTVRHLFTFDFAFPNGCHRCTHLIFKTGDLFRHINGFYQFPFIVINADTVYIVDVFRNQISFGTVHNTKLFCGPQHTAVSNGHFAVFVCKHNGVLGIHPSFCFHT